MGFAGGRRKRLALPLLIFGAGLGAIAAASPARADFRVCNATQNLVGVGIGYRAKAGWITEADLAPPAEVLSNLASVTRCSVDGDVAELEVEGSMSELMAIAAPYGIERVVSGNVDLEDAFLQFYDDQEGR